ncbi:Imm52 family immunity protein [Streptomyces sp. NPDC102283]|uniref:Imm52 family immunity protein n=1 Tax=Streptomyces sp. NPDC102283 TaxID=3366155 RepID=UPI0037FC12E7
MRRVVRGFWGPRPEPAEALADRWRRTLDGFAELVPQAADAWSQVHGNRHATAFTSDGDALLGALRTAQSAADWSDLTGTGLRLVGTGAPGWEAEVSGLAGGAPEFLLQSLAIILHAPDGAVVPEEALLSLVARVWEPDFGDVSDDDVLDALEDDAGYSVGDPVVGRTGYLSPARAALVPDGLEVVREPLPDGGELLSIAAPGDSAGVVRVYQRLREAGALEPLPRPMDRAVL